ncbi:MAG TPA: L-aspartate oxidase [Chloroflexota bacterium]|nr:L-aspartate oxidase [Chloroflexota bacterium]
MIAGGEDLDVLVVGSGIAGLFAALTASDGGQRVAIVTKAALVECNTRYAQGGIAAAWGSDDSPALHRADTIACGGDLNDREAAEVLTSEAAECIDQLIGAGIEFDREGADLALTREAAHSVPRVIHAGGDATGRVIQAGLVAQLRARDIMVLEHTRACDIVSSSGRAVGVRLPRDHGRTQRAILANRVILATGGAGRLFSRTTNPEVATGDGLALAYRAGAELMDLEFFQFHPTALCLPNQPAFLISEAVRGEGGILRDASGRRFMRDYHSDGELAPRDIVARSMWTEMLSGGSNHLFLDLTHLEAELTRRRFPTVWQRCADLGIDISRELIPVAPAAHYFMGGVRTDLDGRTSLPGLFAAGEVACTGAHGANRLASNSLLEGLVFGRRAALAPGQSSRQEASGALRMLETGPAEYNGLDCFPRGKRAFSGMTDRTDLQAACWRNLGIVRSENGLLEILSGVEEYAGHHDDRGNLTARDAEDQNLRLLARLMAKSGLIRTESRGAHFRGDYPVLDSRWRTHIVHSLSGVSIEPIDTSVRELVSA